MENDNYYFIEDSTNKDYIGYKSYVDSLKNAIDNSARFIGLISDFGVGKSSVIKMLKIQYDDLRVATINLWNCNNKIDDNNKMTIHGIFLHQLIEELEIKPQNYYKKKIDKNYGIYDIVLGNKFSFYIYCLIFFYLLFIFDGIGFINIFPEFIFKLFMYTLLIILTITCVVIYKPLVSFKNSDNSRKIDENDTRDLYKSIIEKFFSIRKNRKKTLVICIEELDRFNDSKVVINYIKEFYKFYKLSDQKIVFILSINSACKLAKLSCNSGENESLSIKETYEKVFDFILNINRVNVQDYDSLLMELLEEKKNYLSKKIDFPKVNNPGAWRYLYLGNNITIRDIKHRYNFAISLFLSAEESGIESVSIKKCLYISYLEDEYNELYEKLTNDYNLINKILIDYASLKNLDSINDLTDDEKEVVIYGIDNKYISVDYIYYFFKFPKNKKPYSIYELVLWNAVLFDKDDYQLIAAINKLDEKQIIAIMKKRINHDYVPDVTFKYPKLIRIMYETQKKAFMNTLEQKYDLIDNYEGFKNVVNGLKGTRITLFKKIIEEYFTKKIIKINALEIEKRIELRSKLVSLFEKSSILFKDMFFGENNLINREEIDIIKDLEIIYTLTNVSKINDEYFDNCAKYINLLTNKTLLKYLDNISKNSLINDEWYKKLFNSIDFGKYAFSESSIKSIYDISMNRLKLNELNNYQQFLDVTNTYNDFLDSKYIELLDSNNSNDVEEYVSICNRYSYASSSGVEVINRCSTVFELCDQILNKVYEEKYYMTYIASKTKKESIFEIEEDKFKTLEKCYKDYFVMHADWEYEVGDEMRRFLYNSIDMSCLSEKQLVIFSSEPQNIKIISSVLNKNSQHFINKYLLSIKKISSKYRREVFDTLGKFYQNNGLDDITKSNLIKLTITKEERSLFDGRKRKRNNQVDEVVKEEVNQQN